LFLRTEHAVVLFQAVEELIFEAFTMGGPRSTCQSDLLLRTKQAAAVFQPVEELILKRWQSENQVPHT
jgi:hypothetical protein